MKLFGDMIEGDKLYTFINGKIVNWTITNVSTDENSVIIEYNNYRNFKASYYESFIIIDNIIATDVHTLLRAKLNVITTKLNELQNDRKTVLRQMLDYDTTKINRKQYLFNYICSKFENKNKKLNTSVISMYLSLLCMCEHELLNEFKFQVTLRQAFTIIEEKSIHQLYDNYLIKDSDFVITDTDKTLIDNVFSKLLKSNKNIFNTNILNLMTIIHKNELFIIVNNTRKMSDAKSMDIPNKLFLSNPNYFGGKS